MESKNDLLDVALKVGGFAIGALVLAWKLFLAPIFVPVDVQASTDPIKGKVAESVSEKYDNGFNDFYGFEELVKLDSNQIEDIDLTKYKHAAAKTIDYDNAPPEIDRELDNELRAMMMSWYDASSPSGGGSSNSSNSSSSNNSSSSSSSNSNSNSSSSSSSSDSKSSSSSSNNSNNNDSKKSDDDDSSKKKPEPKVSKAESEMNKTNPVKPYEQQIREVEDKFPDAKVLDPYTLTAP